MEKKTVGETGQLKIKADLVIIKVTQNLAENKADTWQVQGRGRSS